MMTTSALWPQLQATFLQDLKTTQQLKALLEAERTTLENRDYKQFQQLGSDKLLLLNALQKQIQQRQHLFAHAGFSSEQAVLEAAKQQAPVVSKAWSQLADIWQQCQEMNAVNERIAQRSRLVVNQLLDTLRGDQQQKIYTANGDTQQSGLGRRISSA
jgi:flagellar biosynthesis/type III secretory pathway chaperone